MKLIDMEVEGLGRFQKARIDGFCGGVNVLAAPNEAGKSTLFRAIRACLFKRCGAVDKDIRALEADGGKLPVVVALGFEHGGATYRVRKSFLRSPGARLEKDGKEIARNREADEALWELLGVKPGAARAADDAAFGILWVGQRSSFEMPRPSDKAASLIASLIKGEVGDLVGGEQARGILAELDAVIAEHLTPLGKALTSGPLAKAESALDGLRAEQAAVARRYGQLEEQFQVLARLRDERDRLGDPETAAAADRELGDARRDLLAAAEVARQLDILGQEETHAKAKLESAARELQRCQDLIGRVDGHRARVVELERILADLGTKIAADADRKERLVKEIDEFDRKLTAADQELQALRHLEAAARGQSERRALANQFGLLEDAQRRLIEVDARLALRTMTPDALAKIEDLGGQLTEIFARMEAGAASLNVETAAAGKGKVRVEGLEAAGPWPAPVIRPVRVVVGDLASITVTPPVGYGDGDREKAELLKANLRARLAEVDAESAADARAKLLERQAIDAERNGVLAELKALSATDETVASKLESLRALLAKTDHEVAQTLGRLGRSDLPAPDEVQRGIIHAEADRRRLTLERKSAEGRLEQLGDNLVKLTHARGEARGELKSLGEALLADVRLMPDADRASRLAELTKAVALARDAYTAVDASLAAGRAKASAADDLDRRQHRVNRLEQARNTRLAALADLEKKIANLEGQIESAGGDGVGEELAALNDEVALAEREHARIERRVNVLQALRTAVTAALDEGRERYAAPIQRHLAPFLNDVFPGGALDLGEKFEVTALTRAAGPEKIERLSDGTREQVGVLVRLAMGSFLAERGQSVPIILDDALVYSDDDRIQRMFDSITRAGTMQQVVVFTCRHRSFSGLGGAVLRIVEG